MEALVLNVLIRCQPYHEMLRYFISHRGHLVAEVDNVQGPFASIKLLNY